MHFTYLWFIKYIKKKISIFTEIIRLYNNIITLFSKPMLQRLQSECSNQYKVNTYHYINYQDYGCTWNSNYEKNV
jgi:hypothetical protein